MISERMARARQGFQGQGKEFAMSYKIKGKSPENFKHRSGMTNFTKTPVQPCGGWSLGDQLTGCFIVKVANGNNRTKISEMAVERCTNGVGGGDTVFLQSADAV